jgi:hypothetical protein
MDAQWLSYRELAAQLGVSVEAARRRALRGKWSRVAGNDGATRVRVPEDYVKPRPSPDVRPDAPSAVPDNTALVDALRAHIETLKADNEALKADLAAAKARSDQSVAELVKLADRLAEIAARPWWRRLART